MTIPMICPICQNEKHGDGIDRERCNRCGWWESDEPGARLRNEPLARGWRNAWNALQVDAALCAEGQAPCVGIPKIRRNGPAWVAARRSAPNRRCNGGPGGPWCGKPATVVATEPQGSGGELQWFACDDARHQAGGRTEPIDQWFERVYRPKVDG